MRQKIRSRPAAVLLPRSLRWATTPTDPPHPTDALPLREPTPHFADHQVKKWHRTGRRKRK
eukprot:9030855-Prorocentrum_lima.AAC.1